MAIVVERDLTLTDPYTIELETEIEESVETMTNPLETLLDDNGFIKIAALDHRSSLKKMLPENKLANFKALATQTFLPYSTAVLIDPEYGANAIKIAQSLYKEVVLTREISGYKDRPDGRTTELYPQFTSKKLKQMGATAIKLLLYYNSDAPNATKQQATAQKVKEEAEQVNLPVLLEIVTYPVSKTEYHRGDAILRAITDLRQFANILKLEYPVDVIENNLKSAIPYLDQMTSSAEIPWVLLSHGMEFKTYKKALYIAKGEGCKGFAAGRSIWKDIAELDTWDAQVEFIKTTAKDRFEQISKIF